MRDGQRASRHELVLAIFLALAAVGTAWAGFQSAKWSGVQANSYAAAGADRAEASRLATEASRQRTVDVVSFTAWLNALNAEIVADPSVRPNGNYQPDTNACPGSCSSVSGRASGRPSMPGWQPVRW